MESSPEPTFQSAVVRDVPVKAGKRNTLFFFSWSIALRDLHSFPTRRSSDLAESGAWHLPVPSRSLRQERFPYPTFVDGCVERPDSRSTLACLCPAVPRRAAPLRPIQSPVQDRKSTRLNSSHVEISYAVFCLK